MAVYAAPEIAMSADAASDETLLSAIARGDAAALGALYDRYSQLAMAVAYRVLDDHGAAEDAVQDAFLSVWRRVGSFDVSRGVVRAWLLTIVRNAAIDRRRGRHGRALQDTPIDDVAFRLASEGEEVFAEVAAHVDAEAIRAALNALPGEQREAIELAYFGGLTQQEIAERTGSPLGTIKGRMRLGLRKLRTSLIDLSPLDASSPPSTPPAPGTARMDTGSLSRERPTADDDAAGRSGLRTVVRAFGVVGALARRGGDEHADALRLGQTRDRRLSPAG
ncbi:MAG: RNA polymerase sigma factor [Thermomicrobiales bacterium]